MAIILEGNIVNKVIKGANGEFSVGSFTSELGKFKIKDQLLDQFEEGEYRVRVSILHLGIKSYPSTRNGIIITEILADIDAIDVIDAEIKEVVTEPIEPDASIPVDNVSTAADTSADKPEDDKPVEKPELVSAKAKGPSKGKIILSNKKSKPTKSVDNDGLDLQQLFGHLYPLGDTVKLDTTLPRTVIIEQGKYLKSMGYVFDAKTQIWSKCDG